MLLSRFQKGVLFGCLAGILAAGSIGAASVALASGDSGVLAVDGRILLNDGDGAPSYSFVPNEYLTLANLGPQIIGSRPAIQMAPAVVLAAPEAIGFSGNITQGGTKIAVSTNTTVLAANAQRHAYCVKAKKANTQLVHCELGATSDTNSMEYDASAGWCDGGANGVVYAGPITCVSADGSAQEVFVWSY